VVHLRICNVGHLHTLKLAEVIFVVKMLLEIILSLLASLAIGTVWYSKSVFGPVWLRYRFGDSDKWPKCAHPQGAMTFIALGSAGIMILLANLFR